jgi:hypothetical protein
MSIVTGGIVVNADHRAGKDGSMISISVDDLRQFWRNTTNQQTSPRRWRRLWRFGAGGAAGAGAMYFLDPAEGRRRRAQTADQTAGAARRLGRRTGRISRRLGADAYGLWRKALYSWRPAAPVANAPTLADRVMSQVYRDPSIPQGQLNINVEEDIVVVRGELPHPEDIRDLESKIRDVPGVRDVRSYLHLPDTPAPNTQDAREAM